MAYFNGYPVTYTPVIYPGANGNGTTLAYPNLQQPANVQNHQNDQNIIWVQGPEAAKAYNIPPNSNVVLMDSEGGYFYIKSTDHTGMPMPLRTFEYKEVVKTEESNSAPPVAEPSFDPDKYVSKEDYDALKKQIQTMSNRIKNMNRKDHSNAKQSV